MASVILQGTPAVVASDAGGIVSSIVAGQYIAVDATTPDAPIVSSTLVAGEGIAIGAGVANSISLDIVAGEGINITPPAVAGDPVMIAVANVCGVAPLATGDQTVDVANTLVTANSVILCSMTGAEDSANVTVDGVVITPGVGFQVQLRGIVSSNPSTSGVAWFIARF